MLQQLHLYETRNLNTPTLLPTGLVSLLTLDLSRCVALEELPGGIRELAQLRKLVLRGCSALEVFPVEGLAGLKSLEVLDVSDCEAFWEALGGAVNFAEFWVGIRELGQLQELIVCGCDIVVAFPHDFLTRNVNLKVLDFSECSARQWLPDGIGELQALQKVVLRDCFGLVSLPDSICQLSSCLEELDLSGCKKLVALPERIGDLSSLKKLVLSGCSALHGLPYSTSELRSLQKVVLTDFGVEYGQVKLPPCEVVW